MRIVLLAATRRGRLFLEKLAEVAPAGTEIVVCSFREEAHEPAFMDEIRALTERVGGTFFETRKLEEPTALGEFDLMFAVSWRYLVPAAVYRRARRGSFVFHDSLLPKNRGFSPTVWAMINGERETGVTLFEMTERADEGDIVDQEAVGIGAEETIGEVMERVTQTYLRLLGRNLAGLAAQTAPRRAQDHAAATYCPRRRLADNQIDWRRSAQQVFDLIRATTRPYPGAFTWVGERKATVWSAACAEGTGEPGCVIRVEGFGVVVAAGEGAVVLTSVQVEGDVARPAVEVLGRVGLVLGGGPKAS